MSLTREELRYASDVSGGGTGRGQRGNGPTIVDFSTLATSSAVKPTRVVQYAEFLRKFVIKNMKTLKIYLQMFYCMKKSTNLSKLMN